jgi:hypothetical protein
MTQDETREPGSIRIGDDVQEMVVNAPHGTVH